MGLLLSRQRTHQHQQHQHDAEILDTLKQIEHQLVTLVTLQREHYEETVRRNEAWIETMTTWRREDVMHRIASASSGHASTPLQEDVTPAKRRRVKSVIPEQVPDTLPAAAFDNTLPPATEQANA